MSQVWIDNWTPIVAPSSNWTDASCHGSISSLESINRIVYYHRGFSVEWPLVWVSIFGLVTVETKGLCRHSAFAAAIWRLCADPSYLFVRKSKTYGTSHLENILYSSWIMIEEGSPGIIPLLGHNASQSGDIKQLGLCVNMIIIVNGFPWKAVLNW